MAKKGKSKTSGRDTTTPTPYRHISEVPPNAVRANERKQKHSRTYPLLDTDRRRFNPTSAITPKGFLNSDARIKVKQQYSPKSVINKNTNAIFKAVTLKRRVQLAVHSPLKYARRKAEYSTLSERLAFNVPKRLEMCIRRGIRSRVMHAKKHAGKGGQRKPRRNFWSAISC